MRTVCLWLAAAGFVASAALHFLSFTPWAALPGERAVWALGALVFVLAAVMVARLRSTAALGRRWGRVAVHDWRALVSKVPPGLQLFVVGAALYAWMNFVLCLLLDPDAQAQGAITLRMASGHLIFFFLVPLVFFRWVDGAQGADPAAARPCP
ncbi:MAG: hypothetical protein Q7T33_01265 [Dehalococcoidia bacterium]|nr:hypothetical protein [Dehalococcoidia bacterium]